MKRITKYEPSKDSNFPYKLINNELGTELNAIHQLGRFEDLMDEYNINSIEQLENILSSRFIAGGFRSSGKTIVAKGMLYNELSEELGCPLEVVFKKVQELTIENWNQVHCLQYDYDEKLWYIISYSLWDDEFYQDRQYYLKDYQKTWWLKGEKDGQT